MIENNTTTWIGLLADGWGALFSDVCIMIGSLLAPLILFAVVIHWFESIMQHRLVERFGWKSVLWTGWLGTPIHELSHALMCWVFRHRIDEIALFEPDSQSGRLGFVLHSFRKGNWYEEIGNLFIGIAPLFGGSLVLAILLWMFYPDAVLTALEVSRASGETSSSIHQIISVSVRTATGIFSIGNLATARFWVFVYLVLCVGSHMAPSRSDYQGALRGVVLAGGLLLGFAVLVAALGFDSADLAHTIITAAGPMYAILGLTVILCAAATGIVIAATSLFPRAYEVR